MQIHVQKMFLSFFFFFLKNTFQGVSKDVENAIFTHKSICACQLRCFLINVAATQPVACQHAGITFYFTALEVVFLTFILTDAQNGFLWYHISPPNGLEYLLCGVVWTELFCQMLSC